jgi:hypothetical protein
MEATILAQEVYDKLAGSDTKILHIPITGAVLVSACKLKELNVIQARDPKISETIKAVRQGDVSEGRYLVRHDTLYVKGGRFPYWRPVLPAELENQVINYVHYSLSHLGTQKCVYQIAHTFHVKNLGRKVWRVISCCDIYQRVKHHNRSFETESRSHTPKAAGELCAVDLYGPLPTGRGGIRYILVCLDVFTRFVILYALKAATTRMCLQKITKHYVQEVTSPKCILSDNRTQFISPVWKKRLAEQAIEVKFFPVRRPQANPSERFMKEIGKFFKIYCFRNHRNWPELLPKVEE